MSDHEKRQLVEELERLETELDALQSGGKTWQASWLRIKIKNITNRL